MFCTPTIQQFVDKCISVIKKQIQVDNNKDLYSYKNAFEIVQEFERFYNNAPILDRQGREYVFLGTLYGLCDVLKNSDNKTTFDNLLEEKMEQDPHIRNNVSNYSNYLEKIIDWNDHYKEAYQLIEEKISFTNKYIESANDPLLKSFYSQNFLLQIINRVEEVKNMPINKVDEIYEDEANYYQFFKEIEKAYSKFLTTKSEKDTVIQNKRDEIEK